MFSLVKVRKKIRVEFLRFAITSSRRSRWNIIRCKERNWGRKGGRGVKVLRTPRHLRHFQVWLRYTVFPRSRFPSPRIRILTFLYTFAPVNVSRGEWTGGRNGDGVAISPLRVSRDHRHRTGNDLIRIVERFGFQTPRRAPSVLRWPMEDDNRCSGFALVGIRGLEPRYQWSVIPGFRGHVIVNPACFYIKATVLPVFRDRIITIVLFDR